MERQLYHSWTTIGRWAIRTSLDVGRPGLFYFHDVYLGEQGAPLTLPLPALAWLGFSGMTEWRFRGEEDIPQAITGLVAACQRFLDAAPVLLTAQGET